MANKEILSLEIETDSGKVEETERKLSKLDKLLEQTQKRAALLGKTKIVPKLSLDDRFSLTAEKVMRTLSQIQRTKASPTIRPVDNVSASAAKIRASLAGLSSTPWRVSLAGVDWDAIITKPLTELLENGTTFTDSGKKAGETYFQSFLSVIDPKNIAGKLGGGTQGAAAGTAATGTGKTGKGATGSGNGGESKVVTILKDGLKSVWDSTLSIGKDLAKDYAKDGAKSFIDKKILKKDDSNDKKASASSSSCQCKCGGGGYGAGGYGGTGAGERKKGRNGSKSRRIGGVDNDSSVSPNRRIANQRRGSKLTDTLGKTLTKTKSGLKQAGIATLIGGGLSLLDKNGPAILEGGKNALAKGATFVKENTPNLLEKTGGWLKGGAKFLGKVGKAIDLPGPAGLLLDAGTIATAGSKRDKTKATASAALSAAGGAIGGAIGSIIPGAGTIVGATLGSMAGDFLGGKLGGFLYDKFSKKKKKKDMATGTDNLALNNNAVNNNAVNSLPKQIASKSTEQWRPFNAANLNYYQGTATSPQINVTLPKGSVSLTVNKDEINYEEIGKVTAQKITNEIRLAMQNVS
ncbi:hypothetical protein [Paenibacillus sp. DYY-L-2]|uniref:hypothetical protein n=1 Tax=Paenibacillus sp. DYY-L-2 TaxID=3447013 RepID=UPI003F50565B